MWRRVSLSKTPLTCIAMTTVEMVHNHHHRHHTHVWSLVRHQSTEVASAAKLSHQEAQKRKNYSKGKIHAFSTNTGDASAYVGADDFADFSGLRHTGYMMLHARRIWVPMLMATVYYAATPLVLTTWVTQGMYWSLCVLLQRLSVRGRMNTARKDLSGYTCVVTGGTSGIGLCTAMQLLDMGARVVIGARPGREAETREFMNANCQSENKEELQERLTFFSLDLSDQLDVMAFAARIKGKMNDRIDLLVNCAGIWKEEPTVTKQGFEEHIGVNFLGPFHLTEALLPSLRRSTRGGRIVYVTCSSHNGVHRANIVRERMLLKPTPDEPQVTARCYSASKLGNVYHAQFIATRRYEGIPLNQPTDLRPVDVCIADPEFCATNLTCRSSPPLLGTNIIARTLRSLWIRDGYEGSQTVVNCCVRDDIENGGYYSQCMPMPSGLSRQSYDHKSRNEVMQWAMANTIAKYYKIKPPFERRIDATTTSTTNTNGIHAAGSKAGSSGGSAASPG